MSNIPQVQTAAVVTSKSEEIQIKDDQPVTQHKDLAPGECLVKLECTGVCHTGAPSFLVFLRSAALT